MKLFKNLNFTIIINLVVMSTALAYGDGIHDFLKSFYCLVLFLIIFLIIVYINSKINLYYKLNHIIILIASVLIGSLSVSFIYYFQSNELNSSIIIAGLTAGLFISAINSLHLLDIFIKDKILDKNMKIFEEIKNYYLLSIFIGSLIPIVLFLFMQDHMYIIISSFIIPFTIKALNKLKLDATVDEIHYLKVFTYKLFIIFTVIFSISWIL